MTIQNHDDFIKMIESLKDDLISERNRIVDSFRYHFPWYLKKLLSIDSKLNKLDKIMHYLIINKNY